MRTIYLAVTVALALVSSATLAQQMPTPPGEAIGHPPPLSGPPPIAEPSPSTQPPTTAPTPQAGAAASKGYTGAYAPAGTPPTPYSTGPLPMVDTGTGLAIVAPDGVSTKTVKAVPCGAAARETDGFTTCVGIADESPRRKKR